MGKNGLFVRAIVTICVAVYLGVLVVAGIVPASRQLLIPYSIVVAVAGLLLWLFDKWLWSWRPFSWVFKRPDLRGTWRGEIVSEWIDPTTKAKRPPIPAFVCITQTATEVHVRQFTAESESATVAATVLAEADEAQTVVVVYRNEPEGSVRERSAIHWGGMRLRLTADDALSGDYWTDRNTRGRLAVKRISRKKVLSFAQGQALAAG